MMSKMYNNFDAEIKTAIAYLKDKEVLSRLQIPESYYEELVKKATQWTAIFEAYSNEATRTKVITATIRTEYEAFSSEYNHLKRTLKNNLLVTLTAADYVNLNIHKNEASHPNTKPTEVPTLTKVKEEHLYDHFQVSYNQLPDFNHRALPPKVAGANIYYVMGDDASNVPPTETAYTILKRTSAATFAIEYNESDEGKRVFLKARFVNRKGEEGPFSEMISFIVS